MVAKPKHEAQWTKSFLRITAEPVLSGHTVLSCLLSKIKILHLFPLNYCNFHLSPKESGDCFVIINETLVFIVIFKVHNSYPRLLYFECGYFLV